MGLNSRKTSKKTTGIIVGGAKQPASVQNVASESHTKPHNNKRSTLFIAVFVGVVVLLMIGWLIYEKTVHVSVYDIPDMGSETNGPPAKDESPLIKSAAEAAAIQKQIDGYPKDGLSARQKIELANLYSALGAAYSNDGQGDEAILAYETADRYASKEQKRAIVGGLAYAYAAKGQSDEAIAAFEDLIVIIQANPDAFSDRDIAGYRREIEKVKNGESL